MQSKKTSPTNTEKRFGYPHIESLLDSENFEAVNKNFGEAYQKLTACINSKSTPIKTQKEARLAMKAYELTTDLLKELLKLKYVVQAQTQKNQKK